MVDPLGRTTTYAYDGAHRRTQVTSPIGNGGSATTTTGYDGNGRVTASTNAEAETTAYSYDALGRLDAITDPIGRTTSYGYDPTGNRTSVTNGAGETTNWVFDLAGQLTSVTNAEGETTSYTYDGAGNLATVTDPLSRTTSYGYDAVNRRVTTTLPSGDAAATVFDVAGQVTESTSAAGFTSTFGYDSRGLVASITDELGNTQASAYDPAGRLLTATDGRGNNTTFTYDPNGRLQSETDPEGGTVTFGYDVAGQRTSLTDPNGATRTWVYDDGGRLTAATDAEGRTTTFGYDAVSRQTASTDARGITITNSFDDAGQLVSQTAPNENRSFTYDGAGRNTAWTDASGSTSVTFDDVGRMTGITNPAGTVAYGYNAAGEQISMTQPEGTVTTGYDVNGFMDSVTDWRGDTIVMTNDADGRMLTVERSNNVDTTYGYDGAGRLNNIAHTNGATVIDEFAYSLDGNGNRTGVTSTAGTESYTLDGLNRVTDVSYPGGVTEAFTYDPAGNRVEHTNTDGDTIGFTVDDTGQLISDTTGTTYSYDQAGNLLATSAGDAYVYDDYGRTVEASGDGITQTFGYDATDVRVTVDGIDQLWDRNGGLPTLISTGVGDTYVHTAGISRDGDDWLLTDAVGSVRATVDNTGATTGSQDFTVYGEQLAGTGSFGFAGEQQDLTGQLHLRARQYNPTLGRFTTVDPVQPGAPGTTGYNLYTYSGNNPTTWTDPSGRAVLVEYSSKTALIGGAIGFGVGGITCADGQSGLGGAEARCVAAYTIGGAVFGGVGPASSLGPGASCLVGGALGAAEGAAVTLAAGQDGALLGSVIGGGLGCGLGAAISKLGQVISARSADGLIPYIDVPSPTGSIDEVIESVGEVNPASLAADSGGQRLALGLGDDLDDFASAQDAITYRDFSGDTGSFADDFYEFVGNPNNEVLFNLDGVRNPWSSVQRVGDLTLDQAMRAGTSITDWELAQIYRNNWSHVQFFDNGFRVASPFG